jgi:hypothetical protein
MNELHNHHHAVQFYGSDASLFETVAGFLAKGLVAGQPAIVIATPEHRVAIEEHLCDRLIDCEAARRNGDLVILDAEETLDLFMVGDEPDADLFEMNVGRVVDQVLSGRGRTTVRAYGEMVDVLWKEGRSQSAIQLEILWNKLALKHNFALLCGYSIGSFYKQTKQLEEVAALHTHVVDTNILEFPARRAAKLA